MAVVKTTASPWLQCVGGTRDKLLSLEVIDNSLVAAMHYLTRPTIGCTVLIKFMTSVNYDYVCKVVPCT